MISFIIANSSTAFADQVRQAPMYGGIDRSQNPELFEQDNELIAKATRTFGTREHASEGYIEHGFNYYSKNDLDKSMMRFNQAWLLNPENPYSYLGFALLMNKEEQYCKAYEMFKTANEKGLKENGFLADYGYTTAECARLKNNDEKKLLFKVSNQLHESALRHSNNKLLAYVYQSWAKSYYLQNNLIKAREMINQSIKLGGKIDDSFLNTLKDTE